MSHIMLEIDFFRQSLEINHTSPEVTGNLPKVTRIRSEVTENQSENTISCTLKSKASSLMPEIYISLYFKNKIQFLVFFLISRGMKA